MKWFLCVAALIGLVGCSKQADEPVQPESSPVAAAATLVAPPPVLTQQVITDENGTKRTITIPVVPQPVTPVPPAAAPTEDSVRRALYEVINEMIEILEKASDARAVQICKPLVQRVREVGERLNGSNPDLAREQEEIRQIRAALAKCR